MQIIILAAGSGRRMKSLTENQHKSLLSIGNGETFLSKIFHQINEYEISKTVIVTGYLSQNIVDTANRFQFNFEVVHNDRYEEDVNIYSLKLALDRLSNIENTIIIEADIVMDDLSFKDIYFSSTLDKSIWFTRGKFESPQYGGILSCTEDGDITDIRIVKQYKDRNKNYYKLLGVTTIGKGEFDAFYSLINEYSHNSIKQYYLTPWIDNLNKLPCIAVDLNKEGVTSINTPDEYHTYKRLLTNSKEMALDYDLISIDKLIPIEECINERKRLVTDKIRNDNHWIKPIIIDCDNFLIMDGHHRFEAAKELGLKKIPAILVSYDDIEIWSLREAEIISKDLIREKALRGSVYPNKTVKHSFPFEIKGCQISLEELGL